MATIQLIKKCKRLFLLVLTASLLFVIDANAQYFGRNKPVYRQQGKA